MINLSELFANHHLDSVHLDELLGFEVERIEGALLAKARDLRPEGDLWSWGSVLHEGNQTWVGLALETLQTPYEEIKRMCELLAPAVGDKIVDLGAGYGRMALVLKLFWPEVKFLGLEYVRERVISGTAVLKNLHCDEAVLIEADLTREDFTLPEADHYFIYDYGKVPHIRNTLKQLDAMADRKNFKVIARGKGTQGLIDSELPWLSALHREENFSIYAKL